LIHFFSTSYLSTCCFLLSSFLLVNRSQLFFAISLLAFDHSKVRLKLWEQPPAHHFWAGAKFHAGKGAKTQPL
jgi:hypothetical protein